MVNNSMLNMHYFMFIFWNTHFMDFNFKLFWLFLIIFYHLF